MNLLTMAFAVLVTLGSNVGLVLVVRPRGVSLENLSSFKPEDGDGRSVGGVCEKCEGKL